MACEVDINLSRLCVFKFLELFHGDGQWLVGCRDLLRRESLAGVRTCIWGSSWGRGKWKVGAETEQQS